jgi:hypothetical protein
MLTSVGLVERVPAPASLRDHYRLRDNAWAVRYTTQNEVTTAVLRAAEAGIAATELGGLAHARLVQMRDFYTFLMEEIPALLDRWYQRVRRTSSFMIRAAGRGDRGAPAATGAPTSGRRVPATRRVKTRGYRADLRCPVPSRVVQNDMSPVTRTAVTVEPSICIDHVPYVICGAGCICRSSRI